MPDYGRADLMDYGFNLDPAIKDRPTSWLPDRQGTSTTKTEPRDVQG
jgi:hypothetical protein